MGNLSKTRKFFPSFPPKKIPPKISPKIQTQIQGLPILWGAWGLLRHPQETAQAVRQGLTLCGDIIIPALFPFFILSSLVIDLGLSQGLGKALGKVFPRLFRLNGNCATALILGLVGGYPVGAKTAVTLYESGQCSKTEAQRLLAFASNGGPAFFLSVIGVGLFANLQIAYLLYTAHLTACLTVGLLFRYYRPQDCPAPLTAISPPRKNFLSAFLSSVHTALYTTLHVCGFILCFLVVLELLSLSGLLTFLVEKIPLPPEEAHALLRGMLELSSGVTALPPGGNLSVQIPLLAFLLGWAGLSIHCQVLSFLQETDLSPHTYLGGNLLQGVISIVYALILSRFWQITTPVFGENGETLADSPDFWEIFIPSLASSLGIAMIFLFFSFPSKKG